MNDSQNDGIDKIAVITKSAATLKDAGAVLASNKSIVDKALIVGNNFLLQVEKDGGKLTGETDALAAKYLSKVSVRVGEMNGARVVYTQIMDSIKKMFTELENTLDVKNSSTVPAKISALRNARVKFLHEEEKRKDEEAKKKLQIDKQKIDCLAFIQGTINKSLLDFLEKKKLACQNSFNDITLENFDEKEKGLRGMNVGFPIVKLDEITATDKPTQFFLLDIEQTATLALEAKEIINYDAFYLKFAEELKELKENLINRLPSKKEELLEIAAASSKKAKDKLQKEANERQEAAAQKIKDDAEQTKIKADEAIEIAKAASHTLAMFSAIETMNDAIPENRQGYEIVITHQAGYVEIFSHWFLHNGNKSTMDALDKKTLGSMVKWCADHAHKTGEKIESKYITYEPTYKAVNRKAKA